MPCVFCKRKPPEVVMSSERALPQWIAQHVPDAAPPKPRRTERRTTPDDATQPDQRTYKKRGVPHSAFGHKVKVVCKPCNEGWMNDLEHEVRPTLIPMMRGESLRLTWTPRKLLATWTWKTAAMVEFLSARTDRGVPEDHLQTLYRYCRPPATSQVWIAPATGGESSGDLRHYSATFVTLEERAAGNAVPNTYGVAFMLGHVAFLVFGTGRRDLVPPLDPEEHQGHAFQQIWPTTPTNSSLDWPTGVEMDFAYLDASIRNLREHLREVIGRTPAPRPSGPELN